MQLERVKFENTLRIYSERIQHLEEVSGSSRSSTFALSEGEKVILPKMIAELSQKKMYDLVKIIKDKRIFEFPKGEDGPDVEIELSDLTELQLAKLFNVVAKLSERNSIVRFRVKWFDFIDWLIYAAAAANAIKQRRIKKILFDHFKIELEFIVEWKLSIADLDMDRTPSRVILVAWSSGSTRERKIAHVTSFESSPPFDAIVLDQSWLGNQQPATFKSFSHPIVPPQNCVFI